MRSTSTFKVVSDKSKDTRKDPMQRTDRPRGDAERERALNAALQQIERAFGKGSIMRLGDRSAVQIESIPTGSLGLDLALGIGGLPKGRIIEIFGPESSGKTTLALHVVAESQKAGGACAFVDAEHALDPIYARALGVNLKELLISQPDHGEQALEITDTLVRSGAVDVLVIDSVAALVPRSELEGEMGDQLPGLQARLMSQALRKLTATVSRSNCLVIFINQIRMKIGVTFGSPETTSGGNALKFYSSVRLDIRRIGSIKEKERFTGNRTRVKVVKNKLAPPFRIVEFDILFGRGISKIGELIDLGIEAELIEKSGSWLSYNGERLGQGRENARQFLIGNREARRSLEEGIRKAAHELEERMLSQNRPPAEGVEEDEGAPPSAAGESEATSAAGESEAANVAGEPKAASTAEASTSDASAAEASVAETATPPQAPAKKTAPKRG